MRSRSRGPVVIDTEVFGARLTPSGKLLASRYRSLLEGRPVVISFVTVAELEYGARLAGWGTDRVRRLEYEESWHASATPDPPDHHPNQQPNPSKSNVGSAAAAP